jgi:hypothetical protein
MKLSNKPAKGKASKPSALSFSFGKKKTNTIEVDPNTFVFTPELPKVNVIPQSVKEKYEVKGVLRKAGLAAIGLVAVFGLVFAGGQAYTGVLNGQVESIQAEEQALNTKVSGLTPYEQYKTAVSTKRAALSSEVSTDVNAGTIYGDITTSASKYDLELSSISIAQQDDAGLETGGCTSPDPFNQVENIIGCITFQGSGQDPQGSKYLVEDLVGLADPARYASPFISGIATSEEGVTTFDASISFTSALYTQQYSNLEIALDEVLVGATAEPTDSAIVEGDQVDSDSSNTTTFDSTVTTTAQSLVPSLTEDDLVLIDTSATQACSVDDNSPQLETIQSIVEPKIAATDDIQEIMTTLTDTLDAECGGTN